MTDKIREAFEKWWSNSITTQEWKSQKEYAFMGYQAALSSLEQIAKVHRNTAGQISIFDPSGNMFDVYKYIGEPLYRIKTQQELSLEELSALGQELSPDEYQP